MKNNTWKLLNEAVWETLEGRQMMSAVAPAVLSNGVLNVTGSSTANNRITVDLAAQSSQITVDVSGQHETFAANQVKQLNITTGSGSDYIYINPAIDIPSDINSGNGNDSIRGGGGHNAIIAGNGNDIINAEGTNNLIQAGSGNDIIMGHADNNTISAGNGNDYVISLGQADHITVGDGNDTVVAGSGHSTITAGDGHDMMIGGLKNTYLYTKPATTTASTTAGKTSGTTSTTSSTTAGASGTAASGATAKTTTTGTTTTSGSTATTGSSTASKTSTSATTTPTTGTSTTTKTTTTTTTTPVTTTTTTATTTPTTGNVTLPVTTSAVGATAPVAIMNILSGPRQTGLVVNVDALSSKVGTGTQITSTYAWDFGDAGTQYDQLTGFNAAHVYDTPGTYTITLTVTNEAGLVSKTTQQVTIAASTRNLIYVDSVNGSDSNKGTANAPLQSLGAAFAALGNNTEILLKSGDTFYTGSSLHVSFTNVVIGSYGTGAQPQIMRTIGNGLSTIASFGPTNGLTIENITFNSPYPATASDANHKIGVGGIFVGGQNVAVRNCTFLNVDDAINENANPTGVLIQGNSAPLMTGLRGYMVWGQGAQDTIVGNFAANTNVEHIVRCVGVDELNVQDNNFTNHDGKGCIEVHVGENDWIVGNTITDGDIRVGPLGLWGEAASDATTNCVIEDNNLTGTFIFVQSGTHNAMIANNVITDTGGQAIVVNGVDAQGRTSQNISFINNTAIDTGTQGNFIEVQGWVDGITLNKNLWIAPKLALGSYGSAPVYVDGTNLSCFTDISDNVWPDPVSLGTFAAGGINFVGTTMTSANYLSPAQWNAQSEVGSDTFKNVILNSMYDTTANSVSVGAAMKMAA
jgi:PKD repeat protein